MNAQDQIKSRRQTNWDARAAGNFIGGGSGAAVLMFAALLAGPSLPYYRLACVGLVLIALGLFCVWMEIGRPWRALNVFRHAHTSWMTREALIAPPLFLSGAIGIWTGGAPWSWITALLALLFLYCQARMINAAKGIPAWRASRIVALFLATGLTEGAGLLTLGLSLAGVTPQANWMALALLVLLIVRAVLWRGYRKQLADTAAPRQTLAVLDEIELVLIKIGHWGAVLLLLLALTMPVLGGPWLAAGAGLLAALGGWLLKYALIVRASFTQGYALQRVPVRGAA